MWGRSAYSAHFREPCPRVSISCPILALLAALDRVAGVCVLGTALGGAHPGFAVFASVLTSQLQLVLV
eukprot:4141250-Alexandrium_andersonii.AAC.1